jgi:hypothetical protein
MSAVESANQLPFHRRATASAEENEPIIRLYHVVRSIRVEA